MKSFAEYISVQGKDILFYRPLRYAERELDTIYILDGKDGFQRLLAMESYLNLEQCRPFQIALFPSEDWNRDYSPWPAPSPFRNGKPFAGGAGELLHFFEEHLIPEVQARFPSIGAARRSGLLGYSLGGLCALWMFYKSTLFDYAAACSPSVWYPGWSDFVKNKSLPEGKSLYLSLGKREEKTKNPYMARVGPVMRELETHYQSRLGKNFCMEWMEGGHFQDTARRMSEGLQWILRKEL